MRISNRFFIAVGLMGVTLKPGWAASLAGTSENPLRIQIAPVPLVETEAGQVLYLYDIGNKGTEIKPDPYALSVDFDIEIKAFARLPQDNGKQSLPFDQSKSLEVLKAFHLSAKQADGKAWDDNQLKRTVVFSHYDQKVFCARIRVEPTTGWTLGRTLVNAGFDINEIKRKLDVSAVLSPESEAIQVRFEGRVAQTQQDELFKKRYDVWSHFRPTICRPPYLRSAQTDIDALLHQFPDDVWGHAYAGYLDFNGSEGYQSESDKLHMVRIENRTVPDPALMDKLTSVKKHYNFVLKRISDTLPQTGDLDLDKPTVATTEYKALGLNTWLGMKGPDELSEYFNHYLEFIDVREEQLKSGMLLSDSDVLDVRQIFGVLNRPDEISKAIRTELEQRISSADPQRLKFDEGVKEEEKGKIAFALNKLIIGRSLDEFLDLKMVKMSPMTVQILSRKPAGSITPSNFHVWTRQFNRSLIGDIFPHALIELQ